jgi:uncharacterized membrane protein YcaP (DUF421 family)
MVFDWKDILFRVALAFVLVLLSTRTRGKKMIERMSYLDFIGAVTLGSLTGAIMLDHNITLGDLVLAIMSFTMLIFIATFLSLKFRSVRKVIAGLPIELVRDGQILEKELGRARITVESLAQQLRLNDVFDISTVKQAYLETNGKLSVLLRPEAQGLTLGAFLNPPRALPEQRLPIELIIDGNVLTESLQQNDLDLAWLLQELDRHGVTGPEQVAYAVLTSQNKLYLDYYRDNLVPGPPRPEYGRDADHPPLA